MENQDLGRFARENGLLPEDFWSPEVDTELGEGELIEYDDEEEQH